jgi:diguanylate cyclase (GGDEF)-like protein/PAS domain S-box-containing protein
VFAKRRVDPYRELFAKHPHPMWVYDVATLRVLDVNDAACAAYGYSRARFLTLRLPDLWPDEERRAREAVVREIGADRAPATNLWRHRRADGSTFYVDAASSPVTFAGTAARLVLATDATSRVAISRALSESRSALAEAQELAHLGSFETDLRTGEMRWSAELFRILEIDPAIERPQMLYDFDHPDDRDRVIAETERAKRDRTPYTIEHRIVTRLGNERHVFERGRFSYDSPSGEATRVVGAVLDITERKAAEERLRELAERDALTLLPNRTVLRQRLDDALARAARDGENAAVLFVDLDRFKSVNDTLAHAAGDELLRELACRLVGRIGDADTVARPGGDEFIIVLGPAADGERAAAVARDLLDAIAEPIAYEGTRLIVSASIGIALYPRDGVTASDLLRSADAAMYAAKARGGNAYEFFTPQLHLTALAETELERALRAALERDAIDTAYQPIVDATSGRVVALEALARWTENGETIAPARFIALAEETGLIAQLGTRVLERACRDAAALIADGHDIVMCANISTRQFREEGFARRMLEVLEAAGLPPNRLVVEITEGAYMSGDVGMRNMRALAGLGVQLSIDDFGTGYSSLGYLKRLPIDALKIDRSFVADILTDPADQAIVRAIVAVAQNLSLDVIAEGVETAEQAAFLRDIGCTGLQGYYFSRPLAGPALAAFLHQPSLL